MAQWLSYLPYPAMVATLLVWPDCGCPCFFIQYHIILLINTDNTKELITNCAILYGLFLIILVLSQIVLFCLIYQLLCGSVMHLYTCIMLLTVVLMCEQTNSYIIV